MLRALEIVDQCNPTWNETPTMLASNHRPMGPLFLSRRANHAKKNFALHSFKRSVRKQLKRTAILLAANQFCVPQFWAKHVQAASYINNSFSIYSYCGRSNLSTPSSSYSKRYFWALPAGCQGLQSGMTRKFSVLQCCSVHYILSLLPFLCT